MLTLAGRSSRVNGKILDTFFFFSLLEKCDVSEGLNISEETNDCEDEEEDVKDEVQSQGSSASEDYIIILPECFDTSRPLGESMYSSALSQPSMEKALEIDMEVLVPEGEGQPQVQNINDILTTSQTLDTVPLTPEVVSTVPQQQRYGGRNLSVM